MKDLTITIPKSEVYFDVDAVTHVFAKATEGAGLQRADAVEADTGDDFSKSIVTRFADHRATELIDRLGQFIKATAGTSSVTASGVLSSDENYSFTFNVENAFIDELKDALADSMESYIANGTIADWYKAAGDAHWQAYEQMLAVDLSSAFSFIVKRKFPTRV